MTRTVVRAITTDIAGGGMSSRGASTSAAVVRVIEVGVKVWSAVPPADSGTAMDDFPRLSALRLLPWKLRT